MLPAPTVSLYCWACSISAAALARRVVMRSSVSVPRPRSRASSSSMDGGAMKMREAREPTRLLRTCKQGKARQMVKGCARRRLVCVRWRLSHGSMHGLACNV
jgi:hypothetical protein